MEDMVKWTEEVFFSGGKKREAEMAFAIISGSVSNQVNRLILRTLRSEGIDMTPEQWLVLTCLWSKVVGDGPSQNRIAAAVYKDRPSITRLLRNLERQELIIKVSNLDDKRANYIYLTEKGKALEEKVKVVTRKALESVFYGFTQEEIDKVFTCLNRILNNIK